MVNFSRRLQKSTQRGLSLVEIMLVLVVVGLILGASILPLGVLTVDDMYKRESEKIETLHNAITGYAFSHLTIEQTVIVASSTTNERTFVLPAGRPFLPCPDIDGDGLEDRDGFSAVGLSSPALSLRIDATNNGLLGFGNCIVSRGILPWRTLGTPPADLWGNRYTYEVDDVFSNALVGFGQNAVIDQFDIRLTVTINASGQVFYAHRITAGIHATLGLMRGGTVRMFTNKRTPIVVCTGNAGSVAVNICKPDYYSFAESGGSLALTNFIGPRKLYEINDAVEGLPYVIVSHGKNGNGAVNHLANVYNAPDFAMICRTPDNNAISGAAPTSGAAMKIIQLDYLAEAINFPLVSGSPPPRLRYCNPLMSMSADLMDGRFFHQPRVPALHTGTGNATYDDIVSWSTQQELKKKMDTGGIFPVEKFPILRSY